jgi:EAL domain-containing protein (putative c-di-GMP-specific phosphodiesterase class I)
MNFRSSTNHVGRSVIRPSKSAEVTPIRVVMIDDHEMILQSVERLLAAESSIDVVGTALSGAEGIEIVRQTLPDVLVIDFHLPDMDAPEAITILKATHPAVKVVTFSGSERPGSLYESMRAGSSAWVRKTRAIQELRDAIVCVASGTPFLNDEIEAQPRLEELSVHYQPVVSLDDGCVVGFEAFVRWQHPEQGLLYPEAFVPQAELTGFIDEIDTWVRNTAIAQLAVWQKNSVSGPALWMSVNTTLGCLSKPNLLETVSASIASAGIKPQDLVIEIKESTLVNSPDETTDLLHRLHTVGVRLALEDFGSSFSAISYVHKLAFDCLKIGKSFVADLPRSLGTAWLIEGIANVTTSMDTLCIAEGIERMEQVDALRDAGLTLGQGFIFSPPVSAAECEVLLQKPSLLPFQPLPRESAPTSAR